MNTYTPESINKPNTCNVGGIDYKVEEYIKVKDTEEGGQFFAPVIDFPMVSGYKWQLDCLKSRLEHPEIYAADEDVPAVIESLKRWLAEHIPECA